MSTMYLEAMSQLNRLVGEWEVEAVQGGQSLGTARCSFTWIADGGLLLQRGWIEGAEPPPGTPFPNAQVIGYDVASELFTWLYWDARPMSRAYAMTLADGVWRIWRDAPDFRQRFEGVFSDDGDTITGAWHLNDELDFDIVYRRL
jgi:hypothetical protein